MKNLRASLKCLAGTLDLKKLLDETEQQYKALKKEVFDGEDFPAVASKVLVNKTLYTMDEALKYIQVFARYFIAKNVLRQEGSVESKLEKIKQLEETLRERYPIHDNAPILVGQAAEQVKNALMGRDGIVERKYDPISRDPTA